MDNIKQNKRTINYLIFDLLLWIILFIVLGIRGIKVYQQDGTLFDLIIVCVISIINLIVGIRLLVKEIRARKTYFQKR